MQLKMMLSCVQARGQRPLLTAPAETALDLQHVPSSMLTVAVLCIIALCT